MTKKIEEDKNIFIRLRKGDIVKFREINEKETTEWVCDDPGDYKLPGNLELLIVNGVSINV